VAVWIWKAYWKGDSCVSRGNYKVFKLRNNSAYLFDSYPLEISDIYII